MSAPAASPPARPSGPSGAGLRPRREPRARSTRPEAAPHHRVVVIGAGFAGLGAAARLIAGGEDDLVILERAEGVGGCWRANRYPGIQCDVPSDLYSFSFAPNPAWSRAFATGAEIRAYLEAFAEGQGLLERVRFGCELEVARWDEEAQRWRLETSAGPMSASILLSAHGALSAPKTPAIPGLERFKGEVIHSARWPEGRGLAGAKVAVVGTGASAIQIVPSIQPEVARLELFQRTPAWIVPRDDHSTSPLRRWLFARAPWLQKISRGLRFASHESRLLGIMTWPALMRVGEAQARRHLRRQIKDPALRAALTPDYSMGCKRILLSDDFYPAVAAENVGLHTEGVVEVREDGLIGADGALTPADVIVLCTGFEVASHPITHRLLGREGRSLAETWAEGAKAYLGMAVPGFPNLFLLSAGPHTGLGHNSIVYMIESQLAYLDGALAALRHRGGGALEVKAGATEHFSAEMARRLEGRVWSSGCSSFYLDEAGRNVAIWPGFAATYRLRTSRFEPGRFRFEPPALAPGAAEEVSA